MSGPKGALFVAGLVLEIVAFAGSNAEQLPIVLSIVARDYQHAQVGLGALADGQTIQPEDVGFGELVQVFRTAAATQDRRAGTDVAVRIDGARVVQIEREVATTVNPGFVGPIVKVQLVLERNPGLGTGVGDREAVTSTFSELAAAVDAMRPRRLFAANLVVFLIGIAMQVVVVLAAGETHAPENDSGMEL